MSLIRYRDPIIIGNQLSIQIVTVAASSSARTVWNQDNVNFPLPSYIGKFQAHLNLSAAKLNTLQRETGYIRNVALQALIFRYYSYFCAVILQYFSPVLLSFFYALLLKTTGDLSWLGASTEGFTPPAPTGTFRSIFDPTVCRAVWSFSLVFVTFTNVVLSLIGVMYNSYFLPL
ncbi:hypothetical protein COOONC_00601 [Cooperia oncophora]